MKNKNLVLIISVIILIILLIFVVFLGEKKLDINSDKIKNLHASLGEVDTNKCGGLITYSDKTMTVNGNVYVIGNIKIGATINQLINNIRNSSKLIKVYDSNGVIQFDGIESNGVITDSTANKLITTGFKVELY